MKILTFVVEDKVN